MGSESAERDPGDSGPTMSVVDADPVTRRTRVVVPEKVPTRLGIEIRQPVADPTGILAVLDGVEDDACAVRKLVLVVQPDVTVGHVAILLGHYQ